MTTIVLNLRYRRRQFPAEVIAQAIWLYFRFSCSLRMVEDMLGVSGIIVGNEIVRRWADKFGRDFVRLIRRRAPQFGDKWHLDEAVLTINGQKHWLWRAVDQADFVLDALVQSHCDKRAAERLIRRRQSGQMPIAGPAAVTTQPPSSVSSSPTILTPGPGDHLDSVRVPTH